MTSEKRVIDMRRNGDRRITWGADLWKDALGRGSGLRRCQRGPLVVRVMPFPA